MARVSEEAKQRHRDNERERIAAKRAAARAEREAQASPYAEREHRSTGGANGRVLAVLGIPNPAGIARGIGPEVFYSRSGGHLHTPSYEQWLGIPYESPPPSPATLVTAVGRYSYNPGELDDIIRVAKLAADDTGLPENDLRATLSTIEPGRTFTVEPEPREPM